MQAAGVAEKAGVFGWGYNRANFKYDQGLRWQRFTTGRKMAIAQVGMFRQDCTDLASVAQVKMKTYAPILTMSLGYCITVFVEGRSGLKFPGPPVFVSGIYLQCLGIGFAFMTLATWLVFHAAIRAQTAATQLRTRLVRLPVPTQRHLDGARKLLSTWEENSLYDMFKVPFVMPNSADPEGHADAAEAAGESMGKAQKAVGKHASKAKTGKSKGAENEPDVADGVRMPGATKGAPSWMEKEMAAREKFPKASASGHGKDGATEPYEHFELLRQAQREYWGAEAYCRVCFLFGMMHLIHSFGYWLVLHNIAELGMVWCANICAAGLTGGVWLMFRMDVLPEHGGCMPIEAAGPFVTAIALTMMYTGHYTSTIIDVSRAVAVLIIVMHVLWTFRLYSVAKPTNGMVPSHRAGVWRPPLQRERLLRASFVAAPRLPALHLPRGAAKVEAAAAAGGRAAGAGGEARRRRERGAHQGRSHGQGRHDALVLHPHGALRSAGGLARPPDGTHRGAHHGRAHVGDQSRRPALDPHRPVVRLGARPHQLEALCARDAAARTLGLAEGLGTPGTAGALGLRHVRLRPGGGRVVGGGDRAGAAHRRRRYRREHLGQGHHRLRHERGRPPARPQHAPRLARQRGPPPPAQRRG